MLNRCLVHFANGWTISISAGDTPPAICSVAAWPSTKIENPSVFFEIRCWGFEDVRAALAQFEDLKPPAELSSAKDYLNREFPAGSRKVSTNDEANDNEFWELSRAAGLTCDVLLNGLKQAHVYLVDEVEGLICQDVRDANGCVQTDGDDVLTHIQRGKVEIILR